MHKHTFHIWQAEALWIPVILYKMYTQITTQCSYLSWIVRIVLCSATGYQWSRSTQWGARCRPVFYNQQAAHRWWREFRRWRRAGICRLHHRHWRYPLSQACHHCHLGQWSRIPSRFWDAGLYIFSYRRTMCCFPRFWVLVCWFLESLATRRKG